MNNDFLITSFALPKGKLCVYSQEPTFHFKKVKQTHSDIALLESELTSNEHIADAIVSHSKTPLAILTADCLPIVLLGESSHAVIHAGWKGLENNIITHNLIKKIQPTYAFVGPHIFVDHYEVQEDFKSHFSDDLSFKKIESKLFFNLFYTVSTQLEKNYPDIKIESANISTYTDLRFHSYRRNKTTQRNWNLYIPQ